MSASLVGSEMCIRDSSTVAFETPTTTAALLRRPVHNNCALVTRCSRAVSYTHLTLPTICSV
eukprot:14925602-Alexandrium_andersonii.AAC.1